MIRAILWIIAFNVCACIAAEEIACAVGCFKQKKYFRFGWSLTFAFAAWVCLAELVFKF